MPKDLGIVIIAMVGAFALVSKLLREFFRGRERRLGTARDDTRLVAIGRQLETLQQSIDTTAIEVERLGEGLRFTTKLLAERSGGLDPRRPPEHVTTPH